MKTPPEMEVVTTRAPTTGSDDSDEPIDDSADSGEVIIDKSYFIRSINLALEATARRAVSGKPSPSNSNLPPSQANSLADHPSLSEQDAA
jgi:hypothetical protein